MTFSLFSLLTHHHSPSLSHIHPNQRMADKISTVTLKVDLDCYRCYKKISKTICKLQVKMNIQNIAFDEKNNTVTISGRFDPQKLCKKLCCRAGNVIKDIKIKEEKEKPKETKPAEPTEPKKDKPKEAKPAEPAKPKNDKPKDDKPAEAKKDKPKDDKPADKPKETKQDEPKKDKPKDSEPKKDKANPFMSGPAMSEPVFQSVWTGPAVGCTCQQWYNGYNGDNRSCLCSRGYGYMPEGPPPMVYGPQAVAYGAPVYGTPVYGGYKTNTLFCEEDPQESCSIM